MRAVLGVVLAAIVAVPATPAFAAIRPVGPYSWWQGLGAGYWNLDQRLTIQEHTPASTLFWAHQIGYVGMAEGGYLGLQVYGSTKIALFSIWGATKSRGAECGPFFEGGAGHSCRITGYNWVAGRAYRLRVWAQETEGNGRWWGAWVQDTVTGVDSAVGGVFVPFLNLMESRVSWIEYFGGDLASCDAVPAARSYWELPTANNGAVRSSGAVNVIGTGTDCPDSARVTDVAGGTIQQMGPHVATTATVTRVHRSARVTPDSTGRVTIPYCASTAPCQFAQVPAAVLVSGRAPHSGGAIPANLIGYDRTTTGFTLRALNQSGTPITTAIDVDLFAADGGFDQGEQIRTVTVTTNSSGYATVSFVNPPLGVVPEAVVASGVSPTSGTNIPVSLVVSARTSTGFTVRALNQSGAAIANTAVTLSYAAAWTGYLEPGPGLASQYAISTVTTDGSGYANVTFPQQLSTAPVTVIPTGVAPSSGGSIAASVIAHSPSTTGFRIRVLNQAGAVVGNTPVTIGYYAGFGTTATVPGPGSGPLKQGIGIFIGTFDGGLACTGPGIGHWRDILIQWNFFNDACGISQIRAANPGVRIWAYQNFGAMIAGPHPDGRPTTCVTQEEANAQEPNHADSWYVHRLDNGQHYVYDDYSYLAAADVASTTWQAKCQAHLAQIRADGFDGVVFDDVNVGPPNHGLATSVAVQEYPNVDAYAAAVVNAFSPVAAATRAKGLLVGANVGLNPWETAPRAKALQLAGMMDLYVREFFTRWGGTGGNFATPEWEPNVTLVKEVNNIGTAVAAITQYGPGPQGQTQDARYGIASFWVARTGPRSDAWAHGPADHYTSAWGPDIGTPIDPDRVPVGATGWKRRYTAGIAIVNTSASSSITFDLGGSYIDPSGIRVTSVTLAPTSGMVLSS